MGVAKVVLNGDTLIDTTGKTVAADKMLSTYTALDKAGNNVTGNIATKTSSNLTVSGATVTAPAGFYASAASKSVSSMTLPTAASSSSSGTSKATITPSTSVQYINIPTGYNSSAAYYKINAMTALTLPTSTSSSATSGYTSKATITPSTSDQYLNIATGYNSTTSYYKISAMTTMTLPTSASGSATGTNKATIGRSTSVQYIQIPVGYNSSSAYYTISAVPNGTAGTPTATKGTVSNHQVSITPSVTNTTGYITGSTKTGTAVTVTASELASGNKAITSNGTGIDVVGYSTVSVDVPNVKPKYTAKILTTGNSTRAYVQFDGDKYYTTGDTIDYDAGDTLTIYCAGTANPGAGQIYVDNTLVYTGNTYTYTLPTNNIEITFDTSAAAVYKCYIKNASILDFETGTYTPESDIAQPTISFRNTHTDPPMYIAFEDVSSSVYASDASTNTNMWWIFIKYAYVSPTEIGVAATSTQTHYGIVRYGYRGTTVGGNLTAGGANLYYPNSETSAGSNTYPRYWATSTVFKPSSASSTRYWRAGHTFKWIAIWPPET